MRKSVSKLKSPKQEHQTAFVNEIDTSTYYK